ncbi:glycoside hydrolase family 3 N-terminal domain-containing protein [Bacillus sp. J37]|uniref:glycoside hydrolase family 3 N-terminal domain-containing protein n=1 Tax=Bacillus sp. J37 TaxID=935837 RepID=UPI0004B70DE7|nr:glycoside hydrolase family 3 N-terminal domain-containing protein [Bacillus sp. J37]
MMFLNQEQKDKVQELIGQMTLEEKIGQMNQASVSIVGGFDVPFEELIEMLTDGRISQGEFAKIMENAEQDYHEEDIRLGRIGSIMLQNAKKANELQKIAMEESRLGIPLIIGLDVIHGFRTVFPIALAEACSFDNELFLRTARMAAKESRKQGVNWHFAPMIDVSRDARWGRVSEGPGEDPYLVSEFAKAKVNGLQGDTSSPMNYVAACLKHFVAYGAAESGRDYNTTSMSTSLLHNVYLPPFKAAVKEGAATVMAAFNDLNGVPCTVNSEMMRDILKEEYGFKGFVVSDANGIRECVSHGTAIDDQDAGLKAVSAGVDMDMGTGIYSSYLSQLVNSGEIDVSIINEAVERILSIKMWLGLFDHPYVNLEDQMNTIPSENIELALESAKKSIVLLKNENELLPLNRDQKISIIGELADKSSEVVGAWAISWKEEDCVSILDGLEKNSDHVRYFQTGGLTEPINEEELENALDFGDVIVAVVGETVNMSGEAASRSNIGLPGNQQQLLKMVKKSNKPLVAVLMNGRPLALEWEAEHIDAILETWHLGIQMGNAVSDVIFGLTNPSGKLSVSFPRVTGQCPVYYNHPNTGRPGGKSKFTSRYIDVDNDVLYPFGFGLSYTSFKYKDLHVIEKQDKLAISVEITNVGKRKGEEITQLYICDKVASIVRPVKELKDYKKIALEAGETKILEFNLSKNDLGFYDNNGEYKLESGDFIVYVGGSSIDCLKHEIYINY